MVDDENLALGKRAAGRATSGIAVGHLPAHRFRAEMKKAFQAVDLKGFSTNG
ncbi:hypothetical protein GN316_07500 [Xylophilus sp. Kf1]|nr:hypothetical protein [Xylophilus sp. Kf1]